MLVALEPTWLDASDATIVVPIPADATAELVPGRYRLRVRLQDNSADLFEGELEVTDSPGTAVDPPTYCTFKDMLFFAPWVAQVQDLDGDEAGFVGERAQARCDIDDAIIASYRGSSIGLFGSHSDAGMSWAGGGPTRTLMTSQVLRTYLGKDFLMRGTDPSSLNYRPKVRKMAAYRAISIVGLKQIGINQQHAAMGAVFYRQYLAEMSTYVAELDINGDGLCEIPIALVATNTIFT